MSDATRRGIRTAIDTIISVLVSLTACLAIPGINDQFDKLGLGGALTVFSLIVLILLTFFTTLKNKLEDAGKIPALLKAPASGGADPVPDPAAEDLSSDEEFIANKPGAGTPPNPYDDPDMEQENYS